VVGRGGQCGATEAAIVRRRRSWAVGCGAHVLLIYCDFVQSIMLSWDDFCPPTIIARHTCTRPLPCAKFARSVVLSHQEVGKTQNLTLSITFHNVVICGTSLGARVWSKPPVYRQKKSPTLPHAICQRHKKFTESRAEEDAYRYFHRHRAEKREMQERVVACIGAKAWG